MSWIKDIDNCSGLVKQLEKIGKSVVKVGILSKADEKMLIIAAANEFGAKIESRKAMKYLFAKMNEKDVKIQTSGPGAGKGYIEIPERPAIRNAFDKMYNVSDSIDFGLDNFNVTQNAEMMLNAIGSRMVGHVQESYRGDLSPANHPYTTAAKDGKDKTLINTGRLQQAVSFEVS